LPIDKRAKVWYTIIVPREKEIKQAVSETGAHANAIDHLQISPKKFLELQKKLLTTE
jgi:predicted DNA binding protein